MRDVHAFERQPIDELYRWFASEAEPTSPTWARLCRWIAVHPEVNARLDALPGAKRQPNVFLAALKYLGGPFEPGPGFAAWVDARWPELERVILARATQTNEPGRCAVFAPVLASLPQPITLLEIGSSAGLCLLPDRYRYAYAPIDRSPDAAGPVGAESEDAVGTRQITRPSAAGPDAPLLECRVTGTPPGDPAGLVVAARCGLDLRPLDPGDADDAHWLRALVWPGEDAREVRLASCLALAASDPPPILTGDVRDGLGVLLERVAPGSTPVLQHSAVLSYLTRTDRDAVERAIRASQEAGSGLRWLSYEGPSVVTSVKDRLADRDAWAERPNFVVALDGEPIARASAHGGWVEWYPCAD